MTPGPLDVHMFRAIGTDAHVRGCRHSAKGREGGDIDHARH
jgi:hypothetical protein